MTYYQLAVEAVKVDTEAIPIEEPTEKQLSDFQRLYETAMKYYPKQKTDLQLAGEYLFKQSEQNSEYADCWGVCHHLDTTPELAVIGIASELLDQPEAFQTVVFLHELCHLSGTAHDEDFALRFDTCLETYLGRQTRTDSKNDICRGKHCF